MSLRSKTIAVTAAILAAFSLQTWGFVSARQNLESQIEGLNQEIQTVRQANATQVSEISTISTDLETVSEKVGVTAKDLAAARKANDVLKQEQARTTARLRTELANELATKSQEMGAAVDALRLEADSKLTQLSEGQNEATTRIGTVSGDVQTVKGDLDATKGALAANRKEMLDIRDSLGRDIARNATEVSDLRRRGERDYFEFDLSKAKSLQRIATGLQIQLKKADTKAQKFDILMLVDDNKMEKKGQLAKEPIQFFVGRDRLRYELVVYSVDKDRVRGYVSTPKDGVLAAEGPKVSSTR